MKKIINGKMYNTETAHEVGIYSNNLGVRDFNDYTATLYQKKTGEFFLHCVGGANTECAERTPSGWCAGEIIKPMSDSGVKMWCEDHLDADEYITLFGEPEE